MSKKKSKIACLVSHPIQYQVPLYRKISAEADIILDVLFISSMSTREYADVGFNALVKWDIPLEGGYKGYFLDKFSSGSPNPNFLLIQIGLWRILKKNNYEVLWIHGWGSITCIAAILYAKLLGIKVLIRGESGTHLKEPRFFKRIGRKLFMTFLKYSVNGFMAIGSSNSDYYKMFGIGNEKISLVPYAVDNEFFQKQVLNAQNFVAEYRRCLVDPEKLIILFASKLEKRKRADLLIQAFQNMLSKWKLELAHPELLIIGDGVEMQNLRVMVKESYRFNIKFLGFKNQTELPNYYALADIFVLPSEQEPWGLVVNEVMNANCAIIVSSEVGASKDLIESYETGMIFNAGSLVDLEKKLMLLCENPVLIRKISKGAQDRINNWSYKEDIDGLHNALKKLN